jgi:hypothetical protein
MRTPLTTFTERPDYPATPSCRGHLKPSPAPSKGSELGMSTAVESACPVLTVPGAPLAFHVMAKPTGAICNLDCEYCFLLSKEMLYPGSRFRMAEELHEAYIRQPLAAHGRLLARNRAPAELMQTYAAEDAARGAQRALHVVVSAARRDPRRLRDLIRRGATPL